MISISIRRTAEDRLSFRGIDWTVMVVGVLLLRARWPGIRSQTAFLTQLWVLAFQASPKTHFFNFC